MGASSQILFEKFEIKECFKKDEHSAVYLAHHIYLGKKIILKSLSETATPDVSIVDRFKREAKILAKLNHPNIIKVLDFGLYEDHFYISFEYIEGKSLRKCFNDNLSEEDKFNIVVQLLKGLNYAHQHKIIHRDIKPENIFIGNNLKASIGDFGLALSEKENYVTSQYSIVGTPCYMSPEQVKGEALTIQSDLFSLGIVILELYTGRNPFLGNDVNESINNIINFNQDDLLKPISSSNNEIEELLIKLLKKNKKDRLCSAAEGLRILNSNDEAIDFIEGSSVANKKKSIGYATAIFTSILAVIIFYFVFSKSEQPEKTINMVLDSTEVIPLIDTNVSDLVKDDNPNTKMESIAESEDDKTVLENEPKSDEAAENNVSKSEIKKDGFLFVECLPWGNVIVNDKIVETTPLNSNIILKEGAYKLKLSHPEFPDYLSNVKISGDSLTTIKVNLNDLWGYLVCNLYPWGAIHLNGNHLGDTPLKSPIKLSPGKYSISLRNSSFVNKDTTIIVTQNDTTVINYKFLISN